MPLTEEHLLTLIIQSIELREIRLPLVHFFETSFGRTTERRIVLACLTDADGAQGWGECTAGEGPFYSDEWTDSAWATLREFLAPMILRQEIKNAAHAFKLMKPVRGHRMAKATLETACWDLEAKKAGVPLWKHLGGTRRQVASGVSIGIPDIRLMGDANSAYKLADVPLFQELDRFNLMMLEQPLAHNDIFDHSVLQRQIQTPVCLDESIHSAEDAAHALSLESCRIINVKLGRVGGHAEAKRIEQVACENQIPIWCGGMLESGIGRAHNIAMSTLAGFTLPGDVSASARYWEEDIIEPPVKVTSRGTINVPDAPGIGFDINLPRVEALTVRKEMIK
jgi:O-succinylbenzoate synthase